LADLAQAGRGRREVEDLRLDRDPLAKPPRLAPLDIEHRVAECENRPMLLAANRSCGKEKTSRP